MTMQIDTEQERWTHFKGKDDDFIRTVLSLADCCEDIARKGVRKCNNDAAIHKAVQALCDEAEAMCG